MIGPFTLNNSRYISVRIAQILKLHHQLDAAEITSLLNEEDDEGLTLSNAEVLAELTTNSLFVAQGEAALFMLREHLVATELLAEPEAAVLETKLVWTRNAIANHGLALFDTEASGRDRDSAVLIEIAARRLLPDGRWAADFCTKVRLPVGYELDREVVALTQISPTDLADAPDLDTALRQFIAYVGGAALVAHNGAQYDAPLMKRHLQTLADPELTNPICHALDCVLDTLQLAYLALPTAANRKLKQLYKAHRGAEPEVKHEALADVDTMQVVLFDYLLGLVESWSPAQALLIGKLLHAADWPMLALLERRIPDLFANNLRLPIEGGIIDSLALPVQVTPGELAAEPAQRPQVDVEGIADYFAGREVENAFGSSERPYQVRPAQQQMARSVAAAINASEALLIEAGTGTGKTRAYLYPAIRAARGGNRALISTHTRLLQDQLLRELHEAHQQLRYLSEEEWDYAILKGMNNYLCLRKLDRLLEDALGQGEQQGSEYANFFKQFSLAIYASWAAEVGSSADDEAMPRQGYFEELPIYGWEQFCRAELGESGGLQHSVAAMSEDCDRRQCPFYQHCFYMGAVKRAQTRNIVVVNHALLLGEAMKEAEQARLRYDLLVCDEAHTLEDAATEALTVQFDSNTAWGLIDELRRPRDGGHSYGGVLNNASRELGFSLQEGAGDRARQRWAAARATLASFGEGLRGFLKVYAQDDDQNAARYGYRFTLTGVARRQREWLRVEASAVALGDYFSDLRLSIEELIPAQRDSLNYAQRVAITELIRISQQLRDVVDRLKFVLQAKGDEEYVYTAECDPLTEQHEDSEEEDASAIRLPRWALSITASLG